MRTDSGPCSASKGHRERTGLMKGRIDLLSPISRDGWASCRRPELTEPLSRMNEIMRATCPGEWLTRKVRRMYCPLYIHTHTRDGRYIPLYLIITYEHSVMDNNKLLDYNTLLYNILCVMYHYINVLCVYHFMLIYYV